MTALDASWLNFWETVGEWGFVFVIIGVAGEGVEIFIKLFKPKLYKRKKFCLDIIGGAFCMVLVVALAVEFWGNHKAMRIADAENAKLNREAKQAGKDAADAKVFAGQIKQAKAVAHSSAQNSEQNSKTLPLRI